MTDDRRRGVLRWLRSTSNRTFVVYPIAVLLLEAALRGGAVQIHLEYLPLLAWGYLQYKLVGRYRLARGGGGPGLSVPPERLVTTGPYRWTRNPMYLGHLIFMLGLALTLASWPAAALLGFHVPWFNDRAKEDEAQLRRGFGEQYELYAQRVKRWIPFVF